MAIVKFRNFYDDGFDLIDELFTNNLKIASKENQNRFPVNIKEKDDRFRIIAELPGVSDENLEITIDKNILKITANRNKEDEENYHRKEIIDGKLERKFRLPDTVNKEEISADLKNGILIVNLPKKENLHQKIEVNVG